jgi:Spy/CpxP family protein refolding chaperone
MLGFIFGTVCLIGLVKVLRRGRGWHGRWGYGGYGGCGHHGSYGATGYGGYGGYGGPRRWFLRSLFERLETTPGQEKAILAALDELRENRRVVRDEAQQTRADLARAVASGLIDDATLEETFARHDRLLAQLRVSFVEALKKVTEALDERQRRQVGDLLEGGRFGGRMWA